MPNPNTLAKISAPLFLVSALGLSACNGLGGNLSCDTTNLHKVTVTSNHPDLGYYASQIHIDGSIDKTVVNSKLEEINNLPTAFLHEGQELQLPASCSVS